MVFSEIITFGVYKLKSSIPADQLWVVRPYRGVGFIYCKPLNCNIKEIHQDDDRISVIQIINKGLTIVGTYLPFFSGISCGKCNETLDKMHAIIDTVHCLVIILAW